MISKTNHSAMSGTSSSSSNGGSHNDTVMIMNKQLQRSIDDSSTESCLDILNALKKIPVNLDILKKTMIGKTVIAVKKHFISNSSIVDISSTLVADWKKACATPEVSVKTSVAAPVVVPVVVASVVSSIRKKHVIANDNDASDDYNYLPEKRKKIADIITEQLIQHAVVSVAEFFSFNIESAINSRHNADYDADAYRKKALKLIFNLKKNEDLRRDIIDGRYAPSELLDLSNEQLATKEKKEEMKKALEDERNGRRSDYMDATRSERLLATGVDPNAKSEFTCRKCKSNKCRFSERQTRSADEPMTIFVCCITCGFRWVQG